MKNNNWYPWVVVGLLWVVALLNYMDRQMLSTMQEAMKIDISELNKAEAFGALMAVFLWIYGFMSPISGMIADRLNRKWLIVGSLFVWSTVTYLMGYADSFQELYWLRALMGISEALYIPSALSLIADWHQGKSRSLAIGIHMTGLYVGQAVGGFGATIAATFSWHSTFHWFGIIGIAYSLILMFALRENPAHNIKKTNIPINNTEKKISLFSGLSVLFSDMGFLDHSFLFCRTQSSRMGNKKLVTHIIFRDTEYSHVRSRSYIYDYHCRLFIYRSYCRWYFIGSLGTEKHSRKGLHRSYRFRDDNSGSNVTRLWRKFYGSCRCRVTFRNRVRYFRCQ